MGQNESYYDEYYAEARETIPVGLDDIPIPGSFKTADLLRLGATLVAFPIVIGALHKGMGRIGPTLSRGLATGIAKSLRPTSIYTRAFSRIKASSSGPGPTLSQTVESMPKDHFLNILRSRMTKKTTSMTQEYMQWKSRSAQLMAQRRSGGMSPVRARAIRSQEFFRKLSDPKFVKSGMARHAQQYMKRSFAFYGAARIIGGVEGHDDGPSIFNPVGTALDFMKFTVGFYPIDLALLGGGKIISQSFHGGAGALQGALGRNKDNMRKYMARHAAGAAKWREKLASSAYGSRGAWRKYRDQVKWRDTPPHKSVGMVGKYGLAQTGKLLKAGWDQGVGQRRQIIQERRKDPYITEALRVAAGAMDKASRAVGGQTSGNSLLRQPEDT